MKLKTKIILTLTAVCLTILIALGAGLKEDNSKIVSYTVYTRKANIEFYWKDEKDEPFKSIRSLNSYVKKSGKKLKFAMNGGMYKSDYSPLGLFIQNGKTITPLNTRNAEGNFYMKPNGVFLIKENNEANIVETSQLRSFKNIRFATQSGPMLVINGAIHTAFKENSTNLYIRNGVGILADGKTVFAISKEPLNFYEFAQFFKKLGCKNALYLDGFVSRMYCPQENMHQTDGDFGVIIAERE